MQIYKFEYNQFRNTVDVIEIEAEEKPKTYIFKESNHRLWETRISKADMERLIFKYGYKMFSFSPDTNKFLRLIIEVKEKNIENLKRRIESTVEEKRKLQKLLNTSEMSDDE